MKIYVITGHAKSGKTTFGNILRDKLKEYGYKPCVMQITSPLYHYAEDYFEWDSRQDEKPREFLQKFGIEIIKEKLHKDKFLINRLEEDIEILSNFFNCFIITDARFKKELTTPDSFSTKTDNCRFSSIIFGLSKRKSWSFAFSASFSPQRLLKSVMMIVVPFGLLDLFVLIVTSAF